MRRWILLPATGAALYAVAKSDFFARQARGVMDEAKSRAAELPDDLMTRVKQTTGHSASEAKTSGRRSSTSTNGSSGSRPKRSSARKKNPAQRSRTR
jgi:hypothetical protein